MRHRGAILPLLLALVLLCAGCTSDPLGVNDQSAASAQVSQAPVYTYEDVSYYQISGQAQLTMSQELYEFFDESLLYHCGAAVMLESTAGAYAPDGYRWGTDEGTGMDLAAETAYMVLVNNTDDAWDFYICALADGIPQRLALDGAAADYTQAVTVAGNSAVILPFRVELAQVLDREDHMFSMVLIQDGGVLSANDSNIFPFGIQRLYAQGLGTVPCETDARATVARDTYTAGSGDFYLDADLTEALTIPLSGPALTGAAEGQTLYYYRNFTDEDVEYVTFVLWDDVPLQEDGGPVVYYWNCQDASLYLPVTLTGMADAAHTATVVTVQVATEGSVDAAIKAQFFKLSPRILVEGG